jgi:putative uncharacterized protein (fragment)
MNWLSHSIEDRRIILRQTAEAESLPEYAIEKDWWVTMTLKAIFQTECAASLLFKGGTSLSKGWKLIQRSSDSAKTLTSLSTINISGKQSKTTTS